MFNGVSGLKSFSTALQTTSDNVANAGTTGYKANTLRFGDMVAGYYSTTSGDVQRRGIGSAVMAVDTDFAQGSQLGTSNWSDMTVNGPGYFSVAKSDDPTQQGNIERIHYTRDGAFHMDKDGWLVNYQGYYVLGQDEAPIQVENDPTNPIYTGYYVDSNGQIWGQPIAEDPANGWDPVAIGEPVRLVVFPNEFGLIRQGGNLFTTGPESGEAVDVTGDPSLGGYITGYNLESSNVDLAGEMVNMIIYQSIYSANTKSITTARDMTEAVVNLIR